MTDQAYDEGSTEFPRVHSLESFSGWCTNESVQREGIEASFHPPCPMYLFFGLFICILKHIYYHWKLESPHLSFIHTPIDGGKWKWSCSVVSDSLWHYGLQPPRLLQPWDFPGLNTGVSCHFLLQGIFPTQGSTSHIPHCRQTLFHLSHQGIPLIVKWRMCFPEFSEPF